MAIVDNKQVSGSGFKKSIDEDSIEMILDMTQVSQYKKPHRSAVRETVSNAVDSVTERNLAKNIITGVEKLEDHYDVSKSGGQYKGSAFDASYYDTKYFSTKESVLIEYFEKSEGRDLIRITDNGVGLGGKRLEKSFNPGYSSKRTSKNTLGSFGIGAKSPLATGIDSYIMSSVHNGRKYKFRIYVNKVDCLIPKFSNGKMNKVHVFNDGAIGSNEYHAYYEDTSDKNGVVVEWEVKNHNRQTTEDAIKSQLMYFDNVVYQKYNHWGTSSIINLKTSVLFSDDEIVVPSYTNSHTNIPHILLGKEGKYVNYGSIDWKELELPDFGGGIGFKMSPSDVSINPSREDLVWNEKTKSAILAKFEVVKELVNNELKDQLKETDFIKWNAIAESINSNLNRSTYSGSYGYGNQKQDNLVSVLAKLLTTGDGVALKYSNDYSYKSLNSALKAVEGNENTAMREVYVSDKSSYKLNRTPVLNWKSMENVEIWVTNDDKADRIKDTYINEQLDSDLNKSFILIHKKKLKETKISELLFDKTVCKDYDSIVVPEDDRLRYQNKISQSALTPAEIRKLNKKVVAKEYIKGYGNNSYTTKVEYKIGDMMNDFSSNSIIYGHRDDDSFLHFVTKLLPKNTNIKVLLVAQNNLKYFSPYGKHVMNYLFEIDEQNKTVKLCDELISTIRNNFINTADISGSYLYNLQSILPNEFAVHSKLLDITTKTSIFHHSYFLDICSVVDQQSACNIAIASYSGSSATRSFPYLDNLISLGYTIEKINIKEYTIINNLNLLLAPIETFLSSMYNLSNFTHDIDLYLSAKNYVKLKDDHGWI
jgi:hypothetical protein